MKTQDKVLREALIGVLDTFGVDYEDVNQNGTPTLAFNLGNMTYRFGYNSDAPDANSIVRKLGDLLSVNGLTPQPPPSATSDWGESEPSTEEIVETWPSHDEVPLSHEAPPTPEAPQPSDVVVERTPSPRGLLIYRPKPEYAPADVYVVEAKQEYLISVGDRIIIPIHRPDLMMVLPIQEFETRYMAATFERPYEQPVVAPPPVVRAVRPPPPPPPVRRVPPISVQIRTPDYSPPKMQPKARPVAPVQALKTAAPVQKTAAAPLRPVRDALTQVAKPESTVTTRSTLIPGAVITVANVTVAAQLGRILAGIRQAALVTGQQEVSASDAANYMPITDRRQISARIHPAVKCGWVSLRKIGLGFRYKLSPAGEQAADMVAVLCYRNVGLEVPPFIEAMDRRDG
jgi:hypothetical protein